MAIKAQALAVFIAEFTYSDENDVLDLDVELAKGGEAKEKSGDTTRWKLFMDESSNHHSCGADLILRTPSGEQMEYVIRIGFKVTNNEV